MSMAKCKCDKIIDTDEEMNYNETGDCCCDDCFNDLETQFEIDLMPILLSQKIDVDDVTIENIVTKLTDLGYRKVR